MPNPKEKRDSLPAHFTKSSCSSVELNIKHGGKALHHCGWSTLLSWLVEGRQSMCLTAAAACCSAQVLKTCTSFQALFTVQVECSVCKTPLSHSKHYVLIFKTLKALISLKASNIDVSIFMLFFSKRLIRTLFLMRKLLIEL